MIPAGITSETRTDLNVNSTEGVIINNLKPGNYTISEIKSPTGHSLLKQPVSFTVKGDGSIETSGSMGQVGEEDGKSIVLQIRNERLYELPKTGGSGTFVYTISGTLLMLAAALILYKKKSYKNQA